MSDKIKGSPANIYIYTYWVLIQEVNMKASPLAINAGNRKIMICALVKSRNIPIFGDCHITVSREM